jgi:hypothetical protein
MKKKNNKLLILSFSMIILTVTMTYQYFKNEQIKLTKHESKKDNERKKLHEAHDTKTITVKEPPKAERKVAAVMPAQIHHDRIVVGNIDAKNTFPIANQINKDWKKLATKRLQEFVPKSSTFSIEPVKSAVFVKHQIGRYVEHVIIEIKKPDGLVSSFDAYIDSQSGTIVQTWNRTKFEIRPDYQLEATGLDFHSEPLKFDPQS